MTLTILINPVNDLKPVLVNKVVLVVWQNSVTEITPSDLKYADNDTAPEDLMFKVLPPSGGHLALRDSPEVKILEFSQQDIFSRNLIWVSSSSREESARGGFSFQVSDGVHLAEMKRFIIEMRRLDINLELNAIFKCYPNEKTKITKFDFWGETIDKADFQIRAPNLRFSLVEFWAVI